MKDRGAARTVLQPSESIETSELDKLLDTEIANDKGSRSPTRIWGVIVGTVVAFKDNGATPLVTYRGQSGGVAVPARTTVDLHGTHIGRDAVLMFEYGDPDRPIIVGCVRKPTDRSLPDVPGQVEVDADGERLVVSAAQDIVLRCGKSSITLNRDGKIVIRGARVVSHASGVNRIKGGSVQLN